MQQEEAASSRLSYRGEALLFASSPTLQCLRRRVRQSQHSLHNRLLSIHDDSSFLSSLLPHYPPFPVLANLRCGAWYVRPNSSQAAAAPFPSSPSCCYFKSSDSHCLHWTFSPTRCNAAVVLLAAQHSGVMLVDSTRMGKAQPDSFSRTVPIWCCVVNRALHRHRRERQTAAAAAQAGSPTGEDELAAAEDEWDQELHLPESVSDSEKQQILQRIDSFVATFEQSGVDLELLSAALRLPLQPLWIDRSTPFPSSPSQYTELPFIPVLLVNPSCRQQSATAARCGWSYVQGAADDEDNWSVGLTPALFWQHAEQLLAASPADCELMAADIVRADKAEKENKRRAADSGLRVVRVGDTELMMASVSGDEQPCSAALLSAGARAVLHLPTVTAKEAAAAINRHRRQRHDDQHCGGDEDEDVDNAPPQHGEASLAAQLHGLPFLSLPVSGVPKDKRSLQDILPSAVSFILSQRQQQRSVLIAGDDWAVLTAVAITALLSGCTAQYDWVGAGGDGVMAAAVNKAVIRRVCVFVHSFVPDVFPSRLQLKQINQHLMRYKYL